MNTTFITPSVLIRLRCIKRAPQKTNYKSLSLLLNDVNEENIGNHHDSLSIHVLYVFKVSKTFIPVVYWTY